MEWESCTHATSMSRKKKKPNEKNPTYIKDFSVKKSKVQN